MEALITLHLHSTPRGSKLVDADHAMGSALDAGLRLLELEFDNGIAPTGFVAIVVHGAKDVEHVERFDASMRPRISEDGKGIVIDTPKPFANTHRAGLWLAMVAGYCEWCSNVMAAEKAGRRPPVFEQGVFGEVPEVIRDWCGRRATRYVQAWREQRQAALAAATAQPTTVEQ